MHRPVMLQEVIEALHIHPEGIYVDATFGRGGHSAAILARLSSVGQLICIDKDPQALAYGRAEWGNDPRVRFLQGCFSHLDTMLLAEGITHVNGILVDCGVSSPQLDDPARGFSFLRDGPLDMRMDPTQGLSAKEWLAVATIPEMIKIFRAYGEEPFAKKIAYEIAKTRTQAPLETTSQLANLVKDTVPMKARFARRHPATQVFQAIRIHINQELSAIQRFLEIAPDLLAGEGRLALMSFHSLEDRLIKRCFRSQSTVYVPKGIAIEEEKLVPNMEWMVKRQYPSEEEVLLNPRARSAILRVARKRTK